MFSTFQRERLTFKSGHLAAAMSNSSFETVIWLSKPIESTVSLFGCTDHPLWKMLFMYVQPVSTDTQRVVATLHTYIHT